jgi:hypothetical protein
MNIIKKILSGAILSMSLFWQIGISPVSAQGATKVELENDPAVQTFLNAETADARNLLSGFSYQMLENYTDQYMNSPDSQNLKEARKLWLVEEYYKRKADKTASERLFYVFLAVTLLTLLILILTFRIYQMQKSLLNQK